MNEIGFDKVMNVWETKNKIVSPNKKKHLLKIIDKIASPFAAGPFYYFVFNLLTYKFDLVSESVQDVLGANPNNFSFDKIFEIMHPEDLEKLNEKEAVVFDFLFNKIPEEDIPLYKPTYLMRLKHSDGEYKTILHQANSITISKGGKIQKTLCVHTDVTHLDIPIDHKISFISHQRTSYYSIETNGVDKFIENKFKASFSSRELEIIEKLSEGNTFKEMAELFFLSPHTINTHKKNILKKSQCKNTAELVARCIREGVI